MRVDKIKIFEFSQNVINENKLNIFTSNIFPLDSLNFIVWVEVHDIPGGSDQDHPQEKEMRKGKMVVWENLTNSWEEKLKAKEKMKDIPSECRVPKER